MIPANTIRIAIADDHAYFRASLKSLLSDYPNISIVAEAGDGEELLEKLTALPELPDLCLLDIKMPKLDGYATMSIISKQWPSLKVIALSVFSHEYTIIDMLRRGARAFIQKDGDPAELYPTLQAVYLDGFYYGNIMDSDVARLMDRNHPKLTPKEREFLVHCCTDKPYNEIALLMSISPHTIDGYRNSLLQKLKVRSRVGLVLFAMQAGLA